MVTGALIFVVGFVPLYASGITIGTLEGASSFFVIGIFVFLVGFLIRKVVRSFK
jgi:hypothetical protein